MAAASAREARRSRQAQSTACSTNRSSTASIGAKDARRSSWNRTKSSSVSVKISTTCSAVRPCLSEFRLATARPASVWGPLLLAPLRRFAAICDLVAMVHSPFGATSRTGLYAINVHLSSENTPANHSFVRFLQRLFARRQRRGDAEADEGGAGEPALESQEAPIAAEEVAGGSGRQREHPVAHDAEPHEGEAEDQDLPVQRAARGIDELRQEWGEEG